jgi:hypothetical protein
MKYLGRFLFLVAILALGQAVRAVTLSTGAVPSSGVAGTSSVHITGSGFPKTNSAPNTTVSFGTSCLAMTPVGTTTATHVTMLGSSTELVYFTIPGTLPTGTYSVWVTGTSPAYASTSCSVLKVTNSNAVLNSCIPSSSLAVSVGANVKAYVPNGAWAFGATGVQVVTLEGTPAAPAPIPTANIVNACSTNSLSGETICTANNTDVYEITGTTLNKTLTSGASGSANFTGGTCQNCGVAIDAASNRAILEVALAGSPSGSGVQILNLSNDTFNPPVPLFHEVSENIAADPNRGLIMSPSEDGVYDVLKEANDGTITEFTKSVGGILDSGTEDCTTGNALSSSEFTNNVFIEDLSQAIFTPGTPGSYTAPGNTVTLNTVYGFSAGTSGISIAPGNSHLAVVTGEFSGNSAAVLQLPATGGTGTPTILDYAVFQIPDSPVCGGVFQAGADPHTVTAYTSPNDGKAYAVFAGGYPPPPVCLARIDLAAVLAAPRGGSGVGPNDVAAADFPAGAVTYYPTN